MTQVLLEAERVPGPVGRLGRRGVPVAGAQPVTAQRAAFGRLVAPAAVSMGDVLDLVAGDRFVEIGGAPVGVHDRLLVRSGSVEEGGETETAGMGEVLPVLERSLHLPDARRKPIRTDRAPGSSRPLDRERHTPCELFEELGLLLPDASDDLLGERERLRESEPHRLLKQPGRADGADAHLTGADLLAREAELGFPDGGREPYVVDERERDPDVRCGEGVAEATGNLRELVDRDPREARVAALRLRYRPASQGRRLHGRRQHDPREQEREEPHSRVGPRQLVEFVCAARVVGRRPEAGASERPRRGVRRLLEKSTDGNGLSPEERFRPR